MSKTKLTDLPFELLDAICQPLGQVQTIAHLSQTCSTMHAYVQQRGWSNFLRDRLYVKNQFTRNQFPVDALRDLTALSRNLDRRSFHTQALTEPSNVYDTPFLQYGNSRAGNNNVEHFVSRTALSTQGQGNDRGNGGYEGYGGYGGYGGSSRGIPLHPALTRNQANVTNHSARRGISQPDRQSLGFAPQIDSYEYTGRQWDSRKEVIALGAGSRLVLRQVFKGKDALRLWIGAEQSGSEALDRYEHHHRWFQYEKPGSKHGIDDITSLNLLDYAHDPGLNEHVIVGRASGGISLLIFNSHTRMWTELPFETQGSKVKCTSVSEIGEDVLLSAVFGDKTVALFAVDSPHRPTPITTIGPFKANVWSCSFVNDRLAVGFGPSTAPVKIFQVTPCGLGIAPIRSFDVAQSSHDSRERHRSINSLLPSTNAPMLGGGPGDLFFAGCYDGDCLLLDTRSPDEYVTKYSDPIDTSTLYSLAIMGGQRLLAGASRHSLIKVFDLRMPGRTTYYHSKEAELDLQVKFDPHCHGSNGNYNLYLDAAQEQEQTNQRRWRSSRQKESAIYSLSVPSSTSSTVYAGSEGRVIQMDAVSTTSRVTESTDLPQAQRSSMNQFERSSRAAPKFRRGFDGNVSLRMVDHRSGFLLHQNNSPSQHTLPVPRGSLDPSWYIDRHHRNGPLTPPMRG